MQCVDIIVVDDDALEGDESFNLALATSDPNVFIGINETIITIIDNDGQREKICLDNVIVAQCRCYCVPSSHTNSRRRG